MYSLIIVDYCSIDKTMEYIGQFLQKTENPNQITPIVVDNSPETQESRMSEYGLIKTDSHEVQGKTVSIYAGKTMRVAYCFSAANLGYAKGNNLGTIISDELFHNSFYIISNNDIKLVERFDGSVFQTIFEERPDVAVIGPKVVGLDGKPQSPHKKVSAFTRLIAYYWFCRWPFHWKPDYDYDGRSKYCYRVMGSFMIIKREPFEMVSRFDSNTFMFAEEPILSERLLKAGFKTYYYDGWTVIHEHGATIKRMDSVITGEQWAFESCCYFYKQYSKTKELLLRIASMNFAVYKFSLKMRLLCRSAWRRK